MWKVRSTNLLGAFCVMLVTTLIAGCGVRVLTEKDVAGTYEANADWGNSILVLHPDHSFEQTVTKNDHTQASIKGTWKLDRYRGKNASDGIIVLIPFLAVAHDQKGVPAGGAAPSIGRGLLWGITIAADPDFGISFEKK